MSEPIFAHPALTRTELVAAVDDALRASKALTVPALRRRTHTAVQRADAITSVIERLDAYAAAVVYNPARACQMDVRREHAANIVDAVLALTRGEGK